MEALTHLQVLGLVWGQIDNLEHLGLYNSHLLF